jgi:hypothetical protein
MKPTIILPLTILLLLCCSFTIAHNPLMATYTISENEGEWSMDISFTPKGANNAMGKHYGGLNIRRMNPLKFNQLLIKYIKSTTIIQTKDGSELNFGKGKVNSTDHEIVVSFSLTEIPNPIENWQFSVKSFAENPGHYNIVKFIGGGVRQTLVLSPKNKYRLFLNPSK